MHIKHHCSHGICKANCIPTVCGNPHAISQGIWISTHPGCSTKLNLIAVLQSSSGVAGNIGIRSRECLSEAQTSTVAEAADAVAVAFAEALLQKCTIGNWDDWQDIEAVCSRRCRGKQHHGLRTHA
jgi:hypothetical protein